MNSSASDNNQKDLAQKAKEYLLNKTGDSHQSDTSGASDSASQKVRGLTNILDALLVKGKISTEQYNTLKFESVNTSKSVETLLIEQGILNNSQITEIIAEMKGIAFVTLRDYEIPTPLLNKFPKEVAESTMAVPFMESDLRVKVGMKDPLDLQKIKYIESVVGKKVDAYFAPEAEIKTIIETRYGAQIGKEVSEALAAVGNFTLLDIDKADSTESMADIESAPLIKVVNMILNYGISHKSSDIHIEPRENIISVRFRNSGILAEKLTLPKKLLPSIVTRIKILSNAKIDEHRVPQDGRFQVKDKNSIVDVRVSIIPSVYGEKIALRLLEKTYGIKNMEELGIRGISYARLNDALKKTQGIILVTGPTGSGKTQTLASSLKILNTTAVNILTLEDPVEIRMDGVTQVQVNSQIGLTFANGLRSFLRQDPDIIMVGEIRDSETASLAVQAALVGRLVLSTVHTNSAAGAFVRLTDMGVEPFLLSSTVNIVLAQRLVRVLCDCKEPYNAASEQLNELHTHLDALHGVALYDENDKLKLEFKTDTQNVTLYKKVGCPKCNQTGYIGRTGIFEALKMSEKISSLVMKKASISEINKKAIEEGMVTLIQDGYIKALEGITTLEEVVRVKNE